MVISTVEKQIKRIKKLIKKLDKDNYIRATISYEPIIDRIQNKNDFDFKITGKKVKVELEYKIEDKPERNVKPQEPDITLVNEGAFGKCTK